VIAYQFEWDDLKARANVRKHGVSFEEARTVFADPLARDRMDVKHSADEDRFMIVGRSERERILVVIYAERVHLTIRIISARRALLGERRTYEEKSRR
jgi:uncharacterized DUF497 family protein